MGDIDVQKHSVHTLVFRSLKRTHDMFISDQGNLPALDEKAEKIKLSCKLRDDYGTVQKMVNARNQQNRYAAPGTGDNGPKPGGSDQLAIMGGPSSGAGSSDSSQQMALVKSSSGNPASGSGETKATPANKTLVTIGDQKMLVPKKAPTMPKPDWHPPWKLYRVISGHLGWVRCIAFEPGNEWFVTGSGDRVIKIWDLASGNLKLSLTGHISAVRGVVVSPRQPYLFSCGEDKTVKCWDLEYNKVIRHYHGHLSACFAIDLHPTIDVLTTCGRDSTVRVWDMRSKACIHTLAGHTNTVSDVKCQASEPQIISSSHDATIRLWDLAAGKSKVTLTNHKKSVRSVVLHPTQYTMASASPDNIKQWKFPDGNFMQNLSGHNSIVNTLAVNQDNVLVSGGDNGTLYFWDWKTGYNFQRIQTQVQPGSIDSEAGIFASGFDQSGTRFLTCEADKTIKIYKEDDTATEETHPINWKPNIIKKGRY